MKIQLIQFLNFQSRIIDIVEIMLNNIILGHLKLYRLISFNTFILISKRRYRGIVTRINVITSGGVIMAATWFWTNNELDTGNICEQEIVKIDPNIKPRQF